MKRTRKENLRIAFLFGFMALFFCAIVARLAQLQLSNGTIYSEIVERQSTGRTEIPAERGVIFDRKGEVVAKSVMGTSLCAQPESETEVASVAKYLDELFGYKKGTSRREFSLMPGKFRYIRRTLAEDLVSRVSASAPEGLFLRKEPLRQYPFGQVGKQVLGFTDIDNHGQSGFELAYDSVLTGKPGKTDFHRDGLARAFRINEKALIKPVPGRSLMLTIDWRFQEIIEQELRFAVDSLNIERGMAVFIDCTDGNILAMAHYDRGERHPDKPVKLRAIADQFEPGSSAKALTAVGVLDAGLLKPSDMIDCEQGSWRVGRHTLNDSKKHGPLTFTDVIAKSSNIGTGKAACLLGGEGLYDVFSRFGLGRKIKIGLPGEIRGSLPRPERWSEYTTSALAMGHAVAVNALQLAAAFGAIANGGELLRPRLLHGEVDTAGLFIRHGGRVVVDRVYQPSTRPTIHAILRAVVENGTGKLANSPVIAIAGKTGTPQLVDPQTGRYSHNKYLGCFAGFFPYESPRVAGVVVLQEFDRETEAGTTAAPAFRKIAERFTVADPDMFSVPERTLFASAQVTHKEITVSNLVGMSLRSAHRIAASRGFQLQGSSAEGTVVWQFPPAGRRISEGAGISVAVGGTDRWLMPDMTDWSIQAVSAFFHFAKCDLLVEGTGAVVSQSVVPDSLIGPGTSCLVRCSSSVGGPY